MPNMRQGANWESLAGRFYDGIANPADWYAGLDAFRQAVGGALFHQFSLVGLEGSAAGTSLANLETPVDKLQEYEQVHIQNDIRMPMILKAPVGSVMFDHEHFDARTFSRSAIYADWLSSFGLRHTLGVKLRADDGITDIIGVLRDKADTPYGARDRQLCEQLMPHLTRANRLRARMTGLTAQAALGMAALDTVHCALAVVGAGSEVRFLNASAKRALAGNGPLRVHQGLLHSADPLAPEVLTHHIAAACRQHGEPRASSLPLSGRQKQVIQVLPLRPTHPLAQEYRGEPSALLVWTQPDLPRDTAHIATVLGLTEAEARLAWMLAQGHTVKDFAQEQGCTLNTARTHMRNLLFKTGCHRQAKVAQLVRGLVYGEIR